MFEFREVRGVRLSFDWVDAGEQLIVFLHGVGADKSAWSEQITFFSQLGYSVAAIDMRGTGDSQARFESGLAVPISISDFAEDVDALIKDLGFPSAHWVGNSMGGVITMEAMSKGFSTIKTAVLCNTFAKHPDSAQLLPRPAKALQSRSLEAFAQERIPPALRPDLSSDILAQSVLAMARKDTETYLLSWRETWSHDYRDKLSTIAVPSLVITGSLDKITPPTLGLEISSLIPDCKYRMIEGAGHISNVDQPTLFNSIVYDFIREA